jgi:hypothetical protein
MEVLSAGGGSRGQYQLNGYHLPKRLLKLGIQRGRDLSKRKTSAGTRQKRSVIIPPFLKGYQNFSPARIMCGVKGASVPEYLNIDEQAHSQFS